ncbi:phytanoyl-CoA dioxygenase family protein [Blastopirellula retiformator]|uniref:Phytanoyl-CoA dioxygenase (PhyH) n=1 Tax=Blastopirellula retiformator TaxID=2527970 RepID=A0A5C5V8L3_9BACT|nr:phytanoyl-CoA dioxygenase family protein [Blastopirellula retiformator]TWT34187.1 Phytanoyl-CoA dioxygenase (PhyH) [Blastopirellula retiformator]
MAADLSLQHAPVSSTFFRKFPTGDFCLTEEQVAFFHENGYLAGVKILEDEQVEMLREELETFFDANHDRRDLWYEYHTNESATPDTVLFHALGAWRVGAGFHDILWAPPFVQAAEQLINGKVRFWHDQLFCKPANHGGVVAWHQDYSYWTRTKPMAHLTCWIGLDDADRDNGCVQYVPGSHKWDLLPITGLAGNMDAIQEVLTPEQWEQFQQPVAAELKKGEATFHHPLMVHGSFANRTDRPRRAAVINVFRDGVCSDSDDVLLAGVPPVAKGEKMEGQFFPLLSST